MHKRIDSIYDLMLDLFSIARAMETLPPMVANASAEAVLRNAASEKNGRA